MWRDQGEALHWLHAVEECRAFREGDTFSQHLERIATLAGTAPMEGLARLPYKDSE